MGSLKTKPFLKWAGNKFKIIDRIKEQLPPGKRLIEPFLGAAAVFLNTDFSQNLLNDSNSDLINLYQLVQQQGAKFINEVQPYFTKKYNTQRQYYLLRECFNKSTDQLERAILFIYLNRHGYNGLCRYNKKGGFNVPFGRFNRIYFPEAELYHFYEKAQAAVFHCGDFSEVMQTAEAGDVVYCDPPYVPLSKTAYFTAYHQQCFDFSAQERLAHLASTLAARGVTVLLSNHATQQTRILYQEAAISEFLVSRTISCNIQKRQPITELLARYGA